MMIILVNVYLVFWFAQSMFTEEEVVLIGMHHK